MMSHNDPDDVIRIYPNLKKFNLYFEPELEINPIRMDGWMALIYPSIRKIQIARMAIRMAIRVRPKLLV